VLPYVKEQLAQVVELFEEKLKEVDEEIQLVAKEKDELDQTRNQLLTLLNYHEHIEVSKLSSALKEVLLRKSETSDVGKVLV
jgi:predicted ATPase